jgi:hypothetical protein
MKVFLLQIWSKYEEPTVEKPEDEPQERQVTYRNVVVTEVNDDLRFYAQTVENGMIFKQDHRM